MALPPRIATLYFQGFASIRVHSWFFLCSLSDLPGAVGLEGRDYSVKEDPVSYAFVDFDSDPDPDPDPDESLPSRERSPRFSENAGC